MKKKTASKKLPAEEMPAIKRKTKSRTQLEKEILKFLKEAGSKRGQRTKPDAQVDNGLGCVLATSKDNIPRATPVDFYSEGFTIWIIGDPGKKIRNIRSNTRVAVGIFHPMDRSKLNRSLQIQGKAELVNYKEHRKAFLPVVKKFGILSTVENMAGKRVQAGVLTQEGLEKWVEKTLSRFNLIRIDPDEIIFLCVHPTKGMEKNIWKKRARSA